MQIGISLPLTSQIRSSKINVTETEVMFGRDIILDPLSRVDIGTK